MKLATRARTIFDVGANVGVYSLLASKTNNEAEIHAFEPTPEIYQALQQNIRLNEMQNIQTNQIGVGKSSGEAFLKSCRGGDSSNEGMNYVGDEASEDSDRPVQIVALDDYCHQKQIQRIDLLKIDIEGGEHDALIGAQSLLKNQAIGCIFMELVEWAANRSGHSTREIKQILQDADYQIYQLDGERLVEIPAGESVNNSDVIAMPRRSKSNV